MLKIRINHVSHVFIVIFVLFLALFSQESFALKSLKFPKHIAVIDAGSSGTRLYFYRLSQDGKVDMLISNFEYKDEDGIDNYVCDSNAPQSDVMKVVITPLLSKLKEQAKSMTPPVKVSMVEVNLLATAGMRSREKACEALYPGKGAKKVASLYTIIKNGISGQGFKKGEVRTSNGDKEEGVWTWLNMNYVLGTLNATPFGDLEVGGSSTQIVFPVDPGANPLNEHRNIFPVRYEGKDYRVFSKSYLGLGQDDARKWVRNNTSAPEACWAAGFSMSADLGEKETEWRKLERDGNYDSAACTGYYRQYIASKITEQGGGPDAGRSLGDFVGLDGAWYAYEYFLTPPNDAPSQLTSAIPSLCATASSFEGITTIKEVQNQCPSGTYVTTLMFDAEGLFKDSARLVTVSRSNDRMITIGDKNVRERELTWTRGYLLQRYFAN